MLQPLEYPLLGFRDQDNAITETLSFDVANVYHPYFSIFDRGSNNKFDVVIRQ
jgi:hypothetical protein